MEVAFFYLFAGLLLVSSLGVILFRNPVYSVLCLIFCFTNVAGLFVLLGAEFLAMSLVVVYVGAVAVLFLFVIMMLNINIAEIKNQFAGSQSIGVLIALIFLCDLALVAFTGVMNFEGAVVPIAEREISAPTNTHMLGSVIYTDYLVQFQLAGLVLFVAMIGAIVLAHRNLDTSKGQNIRKQLNRTREEGVRLVDIG